MPRITDSTTGTLKYSCKGRQVLCLYSQDTEILQSCEVCLRDSCDIIFFQITAEETETSIQTLTPKIMLAKLSPSLEHLSAAQVVPTNTSITISKCKSVLTHFLPPSTVGLRHEVSYFLFLVLVLTVHCFLPQDNGLVRG